MWGPNHLLHQAVGEGTGLGANWVTLRDDLNARYPNTERGNRQLLDDIWANSNELIKMMGYEGFLYLMDWAKLRY